MTGTTVTADCRPAVEQIASAAAERVCGGKCVHRVDLDLHIFRTAVSALDSIHSSRDDRSELANTRVLLHVLGLRMCVEIGCRGVAVEVRLCGTHRQGTAVLGGFIWSDDMVCH